MSLNILAKLIPPDDPRKVTNWRWFVVIAIVLLLVNVAVGRGLIFAGIGSYAYAAEVAENSHKIDRIEALSLAQTLRGLREDECRANGNKETIRDTMEQFQQDYHDIKGERYPLLSCKELTES